MNDINRKTIFCKQALTPEGWQSDVLITIDRDGRICEVKTNQFSSSATASEHADIVLPAMSNLHSHAFQRAMAGMTEACGPDAKDSFWSWRSLMYRFLDRLSPDDIEAITAFAQIEMLESGYANVGEFHYLHHQPDGKPYSNIAELSERIIAASALSNIGLTLLPVMYEQGGCDGRALQGGQRRFGNDVDAFTKLLLLLQSCVSAAGHNINLGIAPHSLRALTPESLTAMVSLAEGRPLHIHIAEQEAEVEEVKVLYGARPVEWLLANQAIGTDWCLIHATQMTAQETQSIARSCATVGLCPVTESNLGDGIFDGQRFQQYGGLWGVGTDSNVRISLSEELRTLEYSQRLHNKARAVLTKADKSNGLALYSVALRGGAQSLQRNTGQIAVGKRADLLALDKNATAFVGLEQSQLIDAWLFAADDSLVSDVWVSGLHTVKAGMHINRESIERRYR